MKDRSTIQAEQIRREIDELWSGFGQDAEHGVLRACSMTLIVAARPETPGENTADTLASLMKDHPSRAIVVRLRPGGEHSFAASVRAQCWTPFGQHRQICCEHIEIESTEAGTDDLAPVLRALTAPDLPVVLWIRNLAPGIEALYPLAARIIFDTTAAPDAMEALAMLERAAGPGRRVADLNWGRLTRWRQAVAQMFESPEQRANLDRIDRVSVGYRTERPPVRAYYLSAWISRALGRKVAVEFVRETEAERGTIQHVAVSGENVRCSVERAGAGRGVALKMGDLMVSGVFPSRTDSDLMLEELSIPGTDLVYDEVRRLALELARRE